MHAEIITIGDELLLGQTVDTNSAWMGEHLAEIGVAVKRITSISDEPAELKLALDEALDRVDLVILTGGLGPTRDDRTKAALAEYMGSSMSMNHQVLEQITTWFEGRGLTMLDVNRDQAMMPDKCEVLNNPRGTAMGMWFPLDRRQYQAVVSLPGVPYEMKGLMTEEVMPRIQSRWKLPARYHRTILTQGVGESYLSDQVNEWEEGLADKGVSIAYLPAPGQVRIRLSAISESRVEAEEKVNRAVDQFMELAAAHVVSDRDEPLASAVIRRLAAMGWTLGTAESCTGGAIASSITAVPGSSVVFKGSVVAYANAVKEQLLGVQSASLREHGAVSEQVVLEMADGARKAMGVDVLVAVSGIAGPSGGTPTKPVGTIWMALVTPLASETKCLQLGTNRDRNIQRTVLHALAWILRSMPA